MMTKPLLTANSGRNYISHLLQQLTLNYHAIQSEQKEIAALSTPEDEFSLIEEIELLTVNIRGYASQIEAQGHIINESEAVARLQGMSVFDNPVISHFYFSESDQYPKIKSYLRMLDYLRLKLLESLKLPLRS